MTLWNKATAVLMAALLLAGSLAGCGSQKSEETAADIAVTDGDWNQPVSVTAPAESDTITASESSPTEAERVEVPQETAVTETVPLETAAVETTPEEAEPTPTPLPVSEVFTWDESWLYADHSVIHSSPVTLYYSQIAERKDIVVCINAGHGTSGGSSAQTLCHPDGSAKVTGGSTSAGSIYATAVSGGTTLLDGTAEPVATLALALKVKDALLNAGYDVLMLRETDDAQLDNVARTVFANNLADCHIALHYDSSETDKGLFYISVPDSAAYRSMEPVASHWEQHTALGEALLIGMSAAGVPIYGSGSMAIDLTQTSYSTIPSVDLEVGDRASDHSDATLTRLADGLVQGVDAFFMTADTGTVTASSLTIG